MGIVETCYNQSRKIVMFCIIARAINTLVEKLAVAETIFLKVLLKIYIYRLRKRVIYITAFIVT